MITLKDIANKFDAHLEAIRFYNNAVAGQLYKPYVDNKAMALPPIVERIAKIVTWDYFKKEYNKRFEEDLK